MKTTDTDSVYESARQPKEPEKDYSILIVIVPLITLVLICFSLFKVCNRPSTIPYTANDSLKIENAKLKQTISFRSVRIDTVIKRIPYAVESAVKYYDWSVTVSPDTCHTYIANYKRLRDVTDSLLVAQIQLQDSSISDLKTIVINQDVMLRNDSVYIDRLQDSIVKVHKAGKWKYWKGLVHGVGIGVAIDRGILVLDRK